MKRSEMIQKIVKVLHQIQGNEDGEVLWPSEEYIAERVLQTVEDEGMPPPFDTDLYYRTWRNGGSGREWTEE